MPLRVQDRWKIVHTWERTNNFAQTSRLTKFALNTVKLWVKRYQNTGNVDDKPGRGRKRVMTDHVTDKAIQLLLSDEYGTTKAAATELHYAGLTPRVMDCSTIAKCVKQYGKQKGKSIIAVRGRVTKSLNAATKAKRLAFARANLGRSWANVLFTDRKKFFFRYPGERVRRVQWIEKGQKRQAATASRALGVNLYAGISRTRITSVHIVAGTSKHKTTYSNKQGVTARNITALEYADVLQSTLLPAGTQIFRSMGIDNWVLQQDNDPTHKVASDVVKGYMAKRHSSITVLP